MLASLLLLYLLLDDNPPFDPKSLSFSVMGAYAIFALGLVAITWNDWWRDAKLGGPAHAADIVVFALLTYATKGFDSPYFTFFMFVLLAAAIRWGWRVTALTGILLVALYLATGVIVADQLHGMVLHDFADRTGQLIILAFVVIWFGVNQWQSGIYAREAVSFADPSLEEFPLETSLRAVMTRLGANVGFLVWRGPDSENEECEVFVARDGLMEVTSIAGEALRGETSPFLYDVAKDRSLARDERRNLRTSGAQDLINLRSAAPLKLTQGLAIPIRTGSGRGELFLEAIPDLSSDFIDLGADIAVDVASHIERHALMLAVEESAEARSRLALARDLHDSVVQFLAGASFRLEALKRDLGTGQDLEPEINYLKQLMLQEQGELRSFIAALRSAPQIGLSDLAKDLRSLSERLAQQWDVLCEFTAQTSDMMVPSRLHLDAQHLVREAVANAVRHAGAKSVTIRLRSDPEKLKLDFINDGARYPKSALNDEMPRSMSERVKLAGGALELSRGMGVTRISVSLPISGRFH